MNFFPLNRKLVAYPILLFLVPFVVYRGVLPGFRQVDSDFPNYYTAAKIAADGKGVGRLYDDVWFQTQIHNNGMDVQGKFSPFPPATALVYLPLTMWDPFTALKITVIINVGLLLASMFLLSRILSWPYIQSAILTLLSGIGLANCLRLGQLYIALSFLIILGYHAYSRKKPLLAGIAFGLFVPIKYFPIIFLIYFAFRREWRLVLSGIAVALVVSLLGVVVLGWDVHRQFLSVAGNHLMSHYSQQNPFATEFQSWDSLLRRLLIYDPTLNPHPLFDAGDVFAPAKLLIVLSLIAVGIAAIVMAQRSDGQNAEGLACGVLGVLVLLVAPGTATYHLVLLWLPVGLLLNHYSSRGETRGALCLLTLYIISGFIPYSFTKQFANMGLLVPLAYPRLFILLAMFVVSVYFVWNKTKA